MGVTLFHGSMLRSRAAATSAPAKFGIRPCGGNGKRATPSALSLSQTHCRAALLSAKSRAMTKSGAARPGDSQGRNLLHEKPRGDPRLADVARRSRRPCSMGRPSRRPQSKLRCGGVERATLGSGGARKWGCDQPGCGGLSVVEQPASLIGALNSPHDKSADKRQFAVDTSAKHSQVNRRLMKEARRRVAKRYCSVEIQKSAMTAVPGAGIGVGVCTQTKGCGWRPNRVDQAIATPGNTATSATKYCARNSLAIVVPAAWHKASA
jgi:hypothetical protein